MNKIIFLLVFVVVSFFVFGDAHSYCYPGTPSTSNAAPAIPGSPRCMESIESSFNLGETSTKSIYLNEGEIYSAAATGCPRAGVIELTVYKDGEEIATNSQYSPRICFTAPASGNYTFKVKLKTTMNNSSWGNVNACFYKATKC